MTFGRKKGFTIRSITGSKWFWVFSIILFLLQALWIVVSMRYPLIYDENYHLGIIKYYSHQWLPFISQQSPESGPLGDITRYGSYLFHYLMSFPYRIFHGIGLSDGAAIILLRLLDVAMMTGALIMARKLLLRWFSPAITNLSLFVVMMLPITSYLAATINYDNLMILVIMVHLYFVANFLSGRYDLKTWAGLIITSTLGSLVKYAFIPVVAANVILIVIHIVKRHGALKNVLQKEWKNLRRGKNKLTIVYLALLSILSIGLWTERYVVNLVEYHSLQPDCAVLHSIDFCHQWGPWGRDYDFAHQSVAPDGSVSFINYISRFWISGMAHGSTLVGNVDEKTGESQLVTANGGILKASVALFGLLLLLYGLAIWSQMLKKMRWINLPIALYVLALIVTTYSSYKTTGVAAGIQTRYLVWLLPIIIAYGLFIANKFIYALKYKRPQYIEWVIVICAVVVLSQFGGLMTLWVRMSPSWLSGPTWQVEMNEKLHDFANKIIVGE